MVKRLFLQINSIRSRKINDNNHINALRLRSNLRILFET